MIRGLSEGEADAVAAWAERVRRFQEALASAFACLRAAAAAPGGGAAAHCAPFFLLRFGPALARGNVVLFAAASMLSARPGSSGASGKGGGDGVVALVARSTAGLRLRLWAAGVRFSTPLDPALLAFDVGLEGGGGGGARVGVGSSAAESAALLTDLLALEAARSDGSSGAGASGARLSRGALGLLAIHLGLAAGGGGGGGGGAGEELSDFMAAAAEISEEAKGGRGGSGIGSGPVDAPGMRGTAESEGSLLLVTQPRSVAALVQALVECVMPGGQSPSNFLASLGVEGGGGGGGARKGARRPPLPLASIALVGAGARGGGASAGGVGATLDVPQLLALPSLRFRNACACDGEVALRSFSEREGGGKRFELTVEGPMLPTMLPRLALLVAAMQSREGGGGGTVKVGGDAHPVTRSLTSPQVHAAVEAAFPHAWGARGGAGGGGVSEDGKEEEEEESGGAQHSEEEEVALMLLPEVPWLDLSDMEAGAVVGAPREADLAPLFKALPHAPFHGQRLPEGAARAVEGLRFRVPL
jgi:hypothetical protein